MSGQTPETAPKPTSAAAELLHKRNPLRLIISASLLIGWYLGLYQPKEEAIAKLEKGIGVESKRLEIATKIDGLRRDVGKYANKIPRIHDANEYYQSILDGVRNQPIKLVAFAPEKPRDQGPYSVLTLRLEIEATYANLNQFLRWIEGSGRLMRIDMLRIEPHRKNKEMVTAQFQILGLTDVVPHAG